VRPSFGRSLTRDPAESIALSRRSIRGAEFLSLPLGASYSVRMTGYALGDSLLRVRTITNGGNSQFVDAHVPVRTTSVGVLTITAAGVPSALTLDLDGDGRADRTIAPVELCGAAASDFTPSTISNVAPAGRATVGTVNFRRIAADGGSGLAPRSR